MKRALAALAAGFLLTSAGGLAYAQNLQGGIEAYEKGDYELALREFLPLAEKGDAEAQFNLGLMYHNGEGVAQDQAAAARWYGLAAEQGDAPAQHNLGLMYLDGEGVALNRGEALKWFRQAAEQGLAQAQFGLGLAYAIGEGVVQDNVLAHMWFNIAGSKGLARAGEMRDIIVDSMTPSDISTVQQLARECVANNYKNCGIVSAEQSTES